MNDLKCFVCVLACCIVYSSHVSADQQPNYYFPAAVDEKVQQTLITIVDKLLADAYQDVENNDVKKALNSLQAAAQIFPNDYRPYEALASLYARYGQLDFFLYTLEQSTRYYADNDAFFSKVLDLYSANNNVVSVEKNSEVRIANFKDDKSAAISFMFDDGELNVVTDIIPLFKEFDYRMTIPVNPGVTSDANDNPWRGSWEQWRAAYADGFEIANHGMNHRNLVDNVTDDIVDFEINKGYDIIKEKIGLAPMTFIFPFNLYDKRSTELAQKRHRYLRQHELLFPLYPVFLPVYGGPVFSLETANQIVDFSIKHKLWLAPVCHGMKVEAMEKSYKPVTREFLVGHLEHIKARDDLLWVDTIANVYNYLYAKANTKLIVEKKDKKSVHLRLSSDQKLTAGQTLTIVIPIDKGPEKAEAVNLKLKQNYPIVVKSDRLLVDLPINSETITVRW